MIVSVYILMTYYFRRDLIRNQCLNYKLIIKRIYIM